MKDILQRSGIARTSLTLGIAAFGALVGAAVSAPVYVLLGPAVAVSLAGLAGVPVAIDTRFRDICFLVLGLAVGAGFDQGALGTMLRWPVAFVGVAVLTWATMASCRAVLVRGFGFSRSAGLLAGAPGHLSFVIAMAEETGTDVVRVALVQSVRLLALTLVVPFVGLALGMDMTGSLVPQGAQWGLLTLAGLAAVAWAVATGLKRLRAPAPLLIGAMLTAGAFQLTGVQTGVMPAWLSLPAYLTLGALIGTRFAGVHPRVLWRNLGAGCAITAVAVVFAALAAVIAAMALGMPASHVLVAFSPGGLETMIAMGVVLGVVPGFVAACHITRLMVLSVLLPVMARTGG